MLLEPRIVDGKLVYVFSDSRSLSVTGGSTPYVSFNQELLARLDLYEDGETADIDVDQESVFDPEAGELRVTATIDLQGLNVLAEFPVLDEPPAEPAAPSTV